MTVSTSLARVQYDTNGTTGPWTVSFRFLADEDLAVIYTDSSGNETTLVLNTDYTVTGAGDPTGGTVTTTTAYAAGGYITVLRDMDYTQEVDYTDTDSFPAETHEEALDRLTMLVQQVKEVTDRALVYSISDQAGGTLPAAADRANLLLGFDASGGLLMVPATDGTASDVLLTIAALGLTSPVVIGGSSTSSVLELRSTSGAGTSAPATTTDTIKFTRGNNGAQELGRFTPGGSFGIGDFSSGTFAVNEHAGDDGTGTRVVSLMAATAPLFVGMTTRDNSEGGGPVGRSIVSFEGYRLANTAGSRESGALRVITEGVSANQLGARVSILTRRDGQSETDFLERWSVANDGHVLHTGGSGGVASANRSGYSTGETVYTLSGKAGRSVLELATGQADADATILGEISGIDNNNGTDKRVVILQAVQSGATAGNRGGALKVYCKPNGAAQAESFRFTADGTKEAKARGTLQAAPTLTIAANVITPTAPISFLGAGLVNTITVPANMTSHGGRITIIPTAAFTTDATGNIAIASTAVISRAIDFVYDGGTGKWYPSYV